MTRGHHLNVAHISTFPPMRCGIAEFASDLSFALTDVNSLRFCLAPEPVSSSDLASVVDVRDPYSFAALSREIEERAVDVIDLQHEYGIWGGQDGEHLVRFLRSNSLPIVATLHTTVPQGFNERRDEILKELVERSSRCVVLTERSARDVAALAPAAAEKLVVVRHGVPDIPFSDRAGVTPSSTGPVSFISPGFFRPDKGVELVLVALAMLAEIGIVFRYTIVGGIQNNNGDQLRYRVEMEKLAARLGIADRVNVIARDLERSELIEYIRDSDCALLGYTHSPHASSGIIPLVLAAGRWVICTPIEYVKATVGKVEGLIATDAAGSLQLFDRMQEFCAQLQERRAHMRYIHTSMRPWSWSSVATQYQTIFELAVRESSICELRV